MLKVDLDTLGGTSKRESALLSADAVPGAPTDLVPVRGGAKTLLRPALPAVLVLGSSGRAGVSTTALGLAAAAATSTAEQIREPIVVDASAYGATDFAARGCDAQVPTSTVQQWLSLPHPELASAVAACSGRTSTGVRVLARGPEPLPGRESFVSVQRHLETAGQLPVFDAGASVTNQLVAPLIADPRVGLVLMVEARADALNRLSPALRWLDDHYGEFLISRTVIGISEQLPGLGAPAAAHLRGHLGTWVRAVVPIPADAHLAVGGPVVWSRLAGPTRQAYRLILGGLQ